MKAYIENSNCTTVGVHRHCPTARFVGGTSRYVCECRTGEVAALRAKSPGGFTAPNPLPHVGDEAPFFLYHAGPLAIDPERPWQLCSRIGAVCGKFRRIEQGERALIALEADHASGRLPTNLANWIFTDVLSVD